MGFLVPAFFAGLAALAVPVLIHLINRERKVVIQFPSLMFLRKIPYKSVRRQKLRHLLLLALRCLALAILVAAFTRPFLARHGSVSPALLGARCSPAMRRRRAHRPPITACLTARYRRPR
jgi:hypothetical protein